MTQTKSRLRTCCSCGHDSSERRIASEVRKEEILCGFGSRHDGETYRFLEAPLPVEGPICDPCIADLLTGDRLLYADNHIERYCDEVARVVSTMPPPSTGPDGRWPSYALAIETPGTKGSTIAWHFGHADSPALRRAWILLLNRPSLGWRLACHQALFDAESTLAEGELGLDPVGSAWGYTIVPTRREDLERICLGR